VNDGRKEQGQVTLGAAPRLQRRILGTVPMINVDESSRNKRKPLGNSKKSICDSFDVDAYTCRHASTVSTRFVTDG
jgi:hypothetical protein